MSPTALSESLASYARHKSNLINVCLNGLHQLMAAPSGSPKRQLVGFFVTLEARERTPSNCSSTSNRCAILNSTAIPSKTISC